MTHRIFEFHCPDYFNETVAEFASLDLKLPHPVNMEVLQKETSFNQRATVSVPVLLACALKLGCHLKETFSDPPPQTFPEPLLCDRTPTRHEGL